MRDADVLLPGAVADGYSIDRTMNRQLLVNRVHTLVEAPVCCQHYGSEVLQPKILLGTGECRGNVCSWFIEFKGAVRLGSCAESPLHYFVFTGKFFGQSSNVL